MIKTAILADIQRHNPGPQSLCYSKHCADFTLMASARMRLATLEKDGYKYLGTFVSYLQDGTRGHVNIVFKSQGTLYVLNDPVIKRGASVRIRQLASYKTNIGDWAFRIYFDARILTAEKMWPGINHAIFDPDFSETRYTRVFGKSEMDDVIDEVLEKSKNNALIISAPPGIEVIKGQLSVFENAPNVEELLTKKITVETYYSRRRIIRESLMTQSEENIRARYNAIKTSKHGAIVSPSMGLFPTAFCGERFEM